ncbi:hypothetical protein ACP4OV_012147 [Aristida adscensionis]
MPRGEEEEVTSPTPPCQACKKSRSRCPPVCLFACYFPPGDDAAAERYSAVQRVFGERGFYKVLDKLDRLPLSPEQRREAVDSLVHEAQARLDHPGDGGDSNEILARVFNDVLARATASAEEDLAALATPEAAAAAAAQPFDDSTASPQEREKRIKDNMQLLVRVHDRVKQFDPAAVSPKVQKKADAPPESTLQPARTAQDNMNREEARMIKGKGKAQDQAPSAPEMHHVGAATRGTGAGRGDPPGFGDVDVYPNQKTTDATAHQVAMAQQQQHPTVQAQHAGAGMAFPEQRLLLPAQHAGATMGFRGEQPHPQIVRQMAAAQSSVTSAQHLVPAQHPGSGMGFRGEQWRPQMAAAQSSVAAAQAARERDATTTTMRQLAAMQRYNEMMELAAAEQVMMMPWLPAAAPPQHQNPAVNQPPNTYQQMAPRMAGAEQLARGQNVMTRLSAAAPPYHSPAAWHAGMGIDDATLGYDHLTTDQETALLMARAQQLAHQQPNMYRQMMPPMAGTEQLAGGQNTMMLQAAAAAAAKQQQYQYNYYNPAAQLATATGHDDQHALRQKIVAQYAALGLRINFGPEHDTRPAHQQTPPQMAQPQPQPPAATTEQDLLFMRLAEVQNTLDRYAALGFVFNVGPENAHPQQQQQQQQPAAAAAANDAGFQNEQVQNQQQQQPGGVDDEIAKYSAWLQSFKSCEEDIVMDIAKLQQVGSVARGMPCSSQLPEDIWVLQTIGL